MLGTTGKELCSTQGLFVFKEWGKASYQSLTSLYKITMAAANWQIKPTTRPLYISF